MREISKYLNFQGVWPCIQASSGIWICVHSGLRPSAAVLRLMAGCVHMNIQYQKMHGADHFKILAYLTLWKFWS